MRLEGEGVLFFRVLSRTGGVEIKGNESFFCSLLYLAFFLVPSLLWSVTMKAKAME